MVTVRAMLAVVLVVLLGACGSRLDMSPPAPPEPAVGEQDAEVAEPQPQPAAEPEGAGAEPPPADTDPEPDANVGGGPVATIAFVGPDDLTGEPLPELVSRDLPLPEGGQVLLAVESRFQSIFELAVPAAHDEIANSYRAAAEAHGYAIEREHEYEVDEYRGTELRLVSHATFVDEDGQEQPRYEVMFIMTDDPEGDGAHMRVTFVDAEARG